MKEELEKQYERQRKAFEDAEKAKTDLQIEKYRTDMQIKSGLKERDLKKFSDSKLNIENETD